MIKLEIKTQFKTQRVTAADHAVGLMFTNSMLERSWTAERLLGLISKSTVYLTLARR